MIFSHFAHFSAPPEPITVSIEDFFSFLTDPNNSEICENESEKKNGAGFVLAEFLSSAKTRDVKFLDPKTATEVFVFDLDAMSKTKIDEALLRLESVDGVLYSTYKHTEENPRYRLLVRLSEPVPNYNKKDFAQKYRAVADFLGIEYDRKAAANNGFYFYPQHKPGTVPQNFRFRGDPVDVAGLAVKNETDPRRLSNDDFEVTLDRPSRQDLSKLSRNLRTSGKISDLKLATALDAILRGSAFAPSGSRHSTTLRLSMCLVKKWPQLDTRWFADEYLDTSVWAEMYPDDITGAPIDWSNAVEGAKVRLFEQEASKEASAEAVKTETAAPLTEAEIALAVGQRGRLIAAYKGSFFVYCPRRDEYIGPFLPGESPVAVRDILGGLEGVSELKLTKTGAVLKTATELCHEYGTTVQDLIYFAKKPETHWGDDYNALYRRSYLWIDWEPKYHKIVDDLLHTIAGEDKINDLLAYFSQFRNLKIPLPALTLIGPAGVWKSRICEIVSRFWTDRGVSHSGTAPKALGRFNDCLLRNPVIWSDETLAQNSIGKPQPALYRESITARVQHIEAKRMATCKLMSCVRHVVSVNNDEQIFSHEVDTDSIAATMTRFFMLYVKADAVKAFEERWFGTSELDELREGSPLLEHIRWIEKNFKATSAGRLFIAPHTDSSVLLRARFSDEILVCIWQIVFEALTNEVRMSTPGTNPERLPVSVDTDGHLRISPAKISALWADSKAVSGTYLRKPTAQRIGYLLTKAGFKSKEFDSLRHHPGASGWLVDLEILRDFLSIAEIGTWEYFLELCSKIFNICRDLQD